MNAYLLPHQEHHHLCCRHSNTEINTNFRSLHSYFFSMSHGPVMENTTHKSVPSTLSAARELWDTQYKHCSDSNNHKLEVFGSD